MPFTSTRPRLRTCRHGAAFLATAVGLLEIAEAGTINVPAQFPTIQAAIDAAADGDLIAVAPGVYPETIDLLGKPLSLIGVAGSGFTTIDGTGLGGSVVHCATGEMESTIVQGFTITGGTGTLDNQNVSRGGGAYLLDSSPTFIACLFIGNTAYIGGGLASQGGAPVLYSCVFVDNFAGNLGGGVRLLESDAELVECDFIANIGTNGGGVACLDSAATLCDSTFTGNTATNGCGLFTEDASVVVSGCIFEGNFGVQGGGVQNDGGTPIIRRCLFEQNMVTNRGAGILNNGTAAVVANCRFHANAADGIGGGLWNSNSFVSIVNCVLTGNTALLGGGMANESNGSVLVQQTSLTLNTAFIGGGLYNSAGTVPTVLNSVVWTNPGGEITGDATVEHTIVLGGYVGANNIDADPLFVNAVGDDGLIGTPDDDLRLSAGSPGIDAGRNDLVPNDAADLDDDGNTSEVTPLDLDDEARFADDPDTPDTGFGNRPIVDLGAYELGDANPADVNGDGVVDVDDLLAVLLAWGPCPPGPCPADTNGDGIVDVDDLVTVILAWT